MIAESLGDFTLCEAKFEEVKSRLEHQLQDLNQDLKSLVHSLQILQDSKTETQQKPIGIEAGYPNLRREEVGAGGR